jgi:mannose-6-phosphate isomerase-like protein (cupin superfamily)
MRMSTYAVKKIDEMEGIYGGAFKRARAELGVESFGIGIIDMPPNFERYPTHDHGEDGQEEVFVTLRGGGQIEIDGERFPLDADHVAMVGPGVRRKVLPGEEGIRVLILGGKAGAVYSPHARTELGEPDPMVEPSLAPTMISDAARSQDTP